MAQSWHDLLFAHWPVAADALRGLIPGQLAVATFEGQAWVGVVPFRMNGIRLRGLPALPWLSAFPELNVRSYVTLDGRPGVFFFSLDAANPRGGGDGARLVPSSVPARPHGLRVGSRRRPISKHSH